MYRKRGTKLLWFKSPSSQATFFKAENNHENNHVSSAYIVSHNLTSICEDLNFSDKRQRLSALLKEKALLSD